MLEGTTFLVTGATGRLGVEFSRRLEELGAHNLPLVFGKYPDQPKRTAWSARTKPIRINCLGDLQKLPQPDYVINCHWEVNRELAYTEQLAFEINNNLYAPNFLWDWLSQKGIKAFANVSSIKIFSHLNNKPISSETEPRPMTPYGIVKFTAEKFFDAYFENSYIPIIHLRLCSVMSVGEHPSQLISQLLSSTFNKKRIRINKGHLVYLIYIDDAIDLVINAVVGARNGRYNLTSPGLPAEQISELFGKIAGREVLAEYIDFEPTVVDPIFISEIHKFQAGWVRQTPLAQAIRNIIILST
jgi:nucleoside-diphosphate-sugar epimerase